jgi:hypothetical protein
MFLQKFILILLLLFLCGLCKQAIQTYWRTLEDSCVFWDVDIDQYT